MPTASKTTEPNVDHQMFIAEKLAQCSAAPNWVRPKKLPITAPAMPNVMVPARPKYRLPGKVDRAALAAVIPMIKVMMGFMARGT